MALPERIILAVSLALAASSISDSQTPQAQKIPTGADEIMLRPPLNPFAFQNEQPTSTKQYYIVDFLIRIINNVRERGQFNNEIGLITLPKAVRLGNAGGQRKTIDAYDFPDKNIGRRLTRPVLDLSKKPIGPYQHFLRVYNPTTKETIFWTIYEDSITHDYRFFPVGTKDGWYNEFFAEDGREIDGNYLFEPYLLKEEPISYSRGLRQVWGFERKLLPGRAA